MCLLQDVSGPKESSIASTDAGAVRAAADGWGDAQEEEDDDDWGAIDDISQKTHHTVSNYIIYSFISEWQCHIQNL